MAEHRLCTQARDVAYRRERKIKEQTRGTGVDDNGFRLVWERFLNLILTAGRPFLTLAMDAWDLRWMMDGHCSLGSPVLFTSQLNIWDLPEPILRTNGTEGRPFQLAVSVVLLYLPDIEVSKLSFASLMLSVCPFTPFVPASCLFYVVHFLAILQLEIQTREELFTGPLG